MEGDEEAHGERGAKMKIALYIEEGLEQIVLTPETSTEKGLLEKLHAGREMSIHRNSFYRTVGGFVRQSTDDVSTMIVLVAAKKPGNMEEAE